MNTSYRLGWPVLCQRLFLNAVLFLNLLLSIEKKLTGNRLMHINTFPLHCALIPSCRECHQKEVHSHLAFPAIFGNKTVFLMWNPHLLFAGSQGCSTCHIQDFCVWCSPQTQGTAVSNTGVWKQKVFFWLLTNPSDLLCERGLCFHERKDYELIPT